MDIRIGSSGPDLVTWLGMAVNVIAVLATSGIAIWSILDSRRARNEQRRESIEVALLGCRHSLLLVATTVNSLRSLPGNQLLDAKWALRNFQPALDAANQTLARPVGDGAVFKLAAQIQIIAGGFVSDLGDRVSRPDKVTIADCLDRLDTLIESVNKIENNLNALIIQRSVQV